MAVLNPQIPAGGGELVGAPGYIDWAGALWASHMDEESGGIFASAVGADLLRLSAASTAQLSPAPASGTGRPVTTIRSPQLSATGAGAYVELGDATLVAAMRLPGSATSGNQAVLSIGGASFSTAADNRSNALMFSSGRLRADWQQGFGSAAGNSWTGTVSPVMGDTGGGWHVFSYRRDVSAKEIVFGFDEYFSTPVSYSSDPTGGTNGILSVGDHPAGSAPLIAAQLAGVGIFASLLSDAELVEMVAQIRKGASKV